MEKPKKNREGILKKRILTRDFISETPYKIHGPPREPYPCVMTWLGSKARGSVRKIKIYWGPYRKESELSKNIKLGYNPDSFIDFSYEVSPQKEQNRTELQRGDETEQRAADGCGTERREREAQREREGGRESFDLVAFRHCGWRSRKRHRGRQHVCISAPMCPCYRS